MTFDKKTIKDVPLHGKTILVRADYNVPLTKNGEISDDYRLRESLPTLKYLIKAGCKIIICSHLGRPEGKVDPKFSLEPVAERLSELLKEPVGFVPECVGDKVKVAVKHLRTGGVLLLENLRFHPQEEQNDPEFAKKLSTSCGADYFVQDGFGVVHRAHASTDVITQFLPSVAGLLLQKEVTTITHVVQNPKQPVVAVVGGAKIADKIKVLERFIQIADHIIIGGAMANTFLKYKGLPIGQSVYDDGEDALISKLYTQARKKVGDKVDEFLVLPTDVAVATEIGPAKRRTTVSVHDVTEDEYILDMGSKSTEAMLAIVKNAGTVIWSGTLGVAEYEAFAYASAKLAHALAVQKHSTFSLIGGGDTVDFVLGWDSQKGDSFGLVSTGGSASLELMAGETLPGVAALMDR
ncbi:MAG TPA: phosphoglycerate kinase [Candidatus Saccharimonadales bacterium]|nr:phosphoglycerate kinase [Candidatus Saccharimonadales bacterium]